MSSSTGLLSLSATSTVSFTVGKAVRIGSDSVTLYTSAPLTSSSPTSQIWLPVPQEEDVLSTVIRWLALNFVSLFTAAVIFAVVAVVSVV